MARYEFEDGRSHKFWEIEVQGNTFTVRYGRVGTDGQTNTKVFGSPAEAQREADKVTRSKVKKGYAEVAAVTRHEAGRDPGLEAALIERPDDGEAWQVYGDWLLSQGDPRGQLVLAYATGRDPAPIHEEHVKAFLGPFAGDLAEFVQIEWAYGFWRQVRVGNLDGTTLTDEHEATTSAALIGRVLRHDSARFLRELRLALPADSEWDHDMQSTIDAVVKHGIRPSLRHLAVGDFEFPDDSEISWVEAGSVAALWAVLPELRVLEVQGARIELGAITAPKLQKLQLHTGGLGKEPARRLAEADLPAIEHLEIWWGTEDYGGACDAGDVASVVAAAARWPRLRWLGLMNADFADTIPAVLLGSDILPRLAELDLSMGTMTDVGAQVILDDAAQFAHLERLNLDDNFIGDELSARLRAALPSATLAEQEDGDDEYLYVSVGE